jgi:dTDP-4-dehydrorhamnose 3,5-epimerase
LVRVTLGSVFDVAVDARKSSPTFGQCVGVELNDTNHHMLWVPPAFVHGFLALSETVDFLYKRTDLYAPQYERTMCWDDPAVGIAWPIPPGVTPLLAMRDASAANLRDLECFP